MDAGGPLGVPAGAQSGQHSGDAGADVLSEQDEHRPGEPDDAAGGQGLQNTHRGGGGLNQSGKGRAEEDTQQGIGQSGHQADKDRKLPEGGHGGAHGVHADEKDAQTGQNLADVLQVRPLDKDH